MIIANTFSTRLAKSQLPALENLLSIHLEFTVLKGGLLWGVGVAGGDVIPVT